MLHDVDREGDDPARPFLDIAEHAAQRHGQTVVDVNLVDHGQVEILLDHFRGDMRASSGSPMTFGTGRAP